jgi:hypothetical protein
MTTAEDVKRVLRSYAEDNHPNRQVTAIASFNIEDVDDLEQFVSLPCDRLPELPGPPCPASS